MAATCATISPIIGNPTLWQEHGPEVPVQRDPLVEKAATSWFAGSFVVRTGTDVNVVMEPVISAGVSIWGFCPDAAFSAGATISAPTPPTGLFGLSHYVFEASDRIYSMNISDSSATGARIGLNTGVNYQGDGTSGVALAPGQQYGMVRPTSGTYKDVQFIDVTNTTQKLFTIVGLDPRSKITDATCRVLVKVIGTVIQ